SASRSQRARLHCRAFCCLIDARHFSPNEPIWWDASGAKLDVRLRLARHDRVPPVSDTGSPAFRTAIFGLFALAPLMHRLERLSRRRAYASAREAGGHRPHVTGL